MPTNHGKMETHKVENRSLSPIDIPKMLGIALIFLSPLFIIDPLVALRSGSGLFWMVEVEGETSRLILRADLAVPTIFSVFMLFVLSLLVYSRLSKIPLKGFGLNPPRDLNDSLKIGVIGGLVLMLLGDFLESLLQPLYEYFMISSKHIEISTAFGRAVATRGFLYIFLITAIVGIIDPIAEELLFRGVIHTAYQNKHGFEIAVIVSSLVFALAHFDLAVIPIVFPLGVILAYAYYRTESLLTPVLMHMTNNTVVFILYIYGIEQIFPAFYHLG